MTESEIARAVELARELVPKKHFCDTCDLARALLHLSDRVGELEGQLRVQAETSSHHEERAEAAESRAASLVSENRRLREALEELMNQPTENPLRMTPDERGKLWAAHRKARAVLQDTAQSEG